KNAPQAESHSPLASATPPEPPAEQNRPSWLDAVAIPELTQERLAAMTKQYQIPLMGFAALFGIGIGALFLRSRLSQPSPSRRTARAMNNQKAEKGKSGFSHLLQRTGQMNQMNSQITQDLIQDVQNLENMADVKGKRGQQPIGLKGFQSAPE